MFALEAFGRLKRLLNLVITKEMTSIKIGPKQAHILRQIFKKGSCSQRELAEATLSDPAAIGRGIESLLKQGWVTRVADPEDSRTWKVELSAKGSRRIKTIENAVSRVADRFLQNFSKAERTEFLRLLEKASNNMTEVANSKKKEKLYVSR